MMLPQHYGSTPSKTVRQGTLNGGILDSIAQAQNAIALYEKQAEELERTQEMYRMLATTGVVLLFIGGSFLTYKFIQQTKK